MESHEAQALAERFDREGYLVLPNALTPKELEPLRQRYDELMSAHWETVKRTDPDPRRVYLPRLLERDPVFEPLMDWPRTYPIARAILGQDITLASAGEADYRPANSGGWIGWHSDTSWLPGVPYPRQFHWVRCAYFLEDITEDMGPFTLLPGSHRATHPCPPEYTGPDHLPRTIPGQVAITGKAGTCLINNTEIWHTSTPNRDARPRKLLMVLYKHAWMRQWEAGHDVTREFGERQTDPRRRQLCNVGPWHRYDGNWDA